MNNARPIVGISVGDPGGIGPEVTVKALASPKVFEQCRPLVIGDASVVRDALRFTGLNLSVNAVASPEQGIYKPGVVDVLDMGNMPIDQVRYGVVTPQQGKASFEYIAKNIELAMTCHIDATVTGPINKAAINEAGYHYAGHTEIYAEMTGTRDYAMMLAEGNFRVAHVSTHVSLREACDRVKRERVLRVTELSYDALLKLGIASPRIGVAGLNPHCGEGGLFGTEDEREIKPAIADAVAKGMNVTGPVPPDTVFSKMAGGMFDLVVVMYHDQGHIPIKLKGFTYDEKNGQWGAVAGVNITLGLPIVRVSVDHGTAFEIAGQGKANPDSMLDSIELAAWLAKA
ncbi:4-hydroxythreonine-4-phosphate dehydrogenase PdxA [uncultured Desulfovibrio sp.]|uniref:4-hydroxythreonine-4-phosphate dehydrogenase PdxA n=1 Tax=uncultured Desulfovibrio sp. TaxID=167968 RepID=UPI00260F6A69|nr:4-hydroxythreonine-4-phosphate dehydrogenase PdxA [uncultured Desulfovibrio sp.]